MQNVIKMLFVVFTYIANISTNLTTFVYDIQINTHDVCGAAEYNWAVHFASARF